VSTPDGRSVLRFALCAAFFVWTPAESSCIIPGIIRDRTGAAIFAAAGGEELS
jgi:hypothetical protein